ncbi:MAG: N-acyl-D-amino-acid deacylase family protein [Luteimonas sp.]
MRCRLRRCLLPSACLLAALAATACVRPLPSGLAQADVLITGGTVYDGSDTPGRQLDVVIDGDRIVHIGNDASRRYRPRHTLSVEGMVVAPGFIDPHTHPDTYIRADDAQARRNAPWLFQGVTTIFIGIDGGGTPDIAAERQWFEQRGVGTNIAQYVGFGPVRTRVLGQAARAPDADELDTMRGLVAQAMCEGAFGLSTGLFYAPQSFAATDEVVALAREAAMRGGRYDTHQRDESSYSLGLMGSIEEALDIGYRAGLPVHFAHIKALGADVHGQAPEIVARIEQARAAGQQVTADQYPWLASGTSLGAALLPRWAVDGGRAALFGHLDDPESAARIRAEMQENLHRRGGAEALLLTGSGWPWSGRTLEAMADAWHIGPVEAALRIIREGGIDNRGTAGAYRIASFNMDKADVDLLMRQPWVMTASDGSNGHPRQYGTFPEKYARFVRDEGVISLQDFVHRSTGLTATTMGLDDRGFLRAGMLADIVVFDPARFAARADYVDPRQLSEGVVHLFVNGTQMIDDGRLTDALPGRVLQHVPTAGSCP